MTPHSWDGQGMSVSISAGEGRVRRHDTALFGVSTDAHLCGGIQRKIYLPTCPYCYLMGSSHKPIGYKFPSITLPRKIMLWTKVEPTSLESENPNKWIYWTFPMRFALNISRFLRESKGSSLLLSSIAFIHHCITIPTSTEDFQYYLVNPPQASLIVLIKEDLIYCVSRSEWIRVPHYQMHIE